MDLVDLLMKGHQTLRASLKNMSAVLGRPCGVGWEDRTSMDREKFLKKVDEFMTAFRMHEAVEDDILIRVVRQLGTDHALDAAIDEGHRTLREITNLFSVIVTECDGEHAYRVRTVLARLSDELERHMSYEETKVFPRLRERLPPGLLRALARRAIAKQRGGAKSVRRTSPARA